MGLCGLMMPFLWLLASEGVRTWSPSSRIFLTKHPSHPTLKCAGLPASVWKIVELFPFQRLLKTSSSFLATDDTIQKHTHPPKTHEASTWEDKGGEGALNRCCWTQWHWWRLGEDTSRGKTPPSQVRSLEGYNLSMFFGAMIVGALMLCVFGWKENE